MKNLFILSLFCASLIGCATFGPKEDSPEFKSIISTAVGSTPVITAKSASWLPNTFGFNNVLSRENPIVGAFVLTENEIVFLVWDENSSKFIRAKSIRRVDISEAKVATFGRSRRLVLVSNVNVDSFELTTPSQNFVDADAVINIANILTKKGNP